MRTVAAFPDHFRATRHANLVRVGRWWNMRAQFCPEGEEPVDSLHYVCTRSRLGTRKMLRTKAVSGRGPKRSAWVEWVYPELLLAFEHYQKAGVKFSARLLIELAETILFDPTSPYTIHSRDPKDNIFLSKKITPSWAQQFMHTYNLVLLTQRGRLICSPEKELQIERQTTHHLGVLHRGF